MTSRDFCYWLQGFFELSPAVGELSQQQVEQIRNHLHMVFAHEIDPSFGDKLKQQLLSEIHDAKQDGKQDVNAPTSPVPAPTGAPARRPSWDPFGPKIKC